MEFWFLCGPVSKETTPETARSKAWVCGRSPGGITGSNPAGSMNVCCECRVLSGRVSAMGQSLDRRSPTKLGVSECGFETRRWRHLGPRGSSNHVQKKIYKYNINGNDLKPQVSLLPVTRVVVCGPWPHLQTMYVLQKLLKIQMVRYNTTTFFMCGPRPSPQYRVWPFAIKRMESVAERLKRGDNAPVLIYPRSRHTWVGSLESSQIQT